jgi:hypothetical protein
MLNLERTTRKLLSIQKAIHTDPSGQEVFVGLSPEESKRYVELWHEATDELIDLHRKHAIAHSGIEDL